MKRLIGKFGPSIAVLQALALVLMSTIAHAALEDHGIHTADTEAQLDWLDLSETADLSFNEVNALFNTALAEYRFATRDEVITLFQHAGLPHIDNGPSPANFTPGVILMDLWNADIWALGGLSGQFGFFYTNDGGTGILWTRSPMTTEATTGPNRLAGAENPDFSIHYLGSALVKPSAVPLPASLPLFIAAAIGLVRRRCRT